MSNYQGYECSFQCNLYPYITWSGTTTSATVDSTFLTGSLWNGVASYPITLTCSNSTWISGMKYSTEGCTLTWNNTDIQLTMPYTFFNTYQYDSKKQLKDLIKQRSLNIFTPRSKLNRDFDNREVAARNVLRKIIGEEKYKKFLKYGFISVKARSDKTYLIYPGHDFTRVINNGIEERSLCVVFGDFPPTDSLITRFLMIMNDEKEFNKIANKQSVYKKRKQYNNSNIDLLEVKRSLAG